MKKLILCAALAVFGLTYVNAQDENSGGQGFSFGPKAGVNFSTITGDFTDDVKMKVGFHIGGAALFMFNEKMGVQGELLYSSQGAKYEYNDSFGGVVEKEESNLKLAYLNIPFSFKFFIVDGLNVAAGPQASILLSAKEDYERTVTSGGNTVTTSDEDDVKDFVTPFDFGFHIGAGYRMTNGLTFDARYNIGFLNVNDFSGADDFNQRNSVIQVSVGFMF